MAAHQEPSSYSTLIGQRLFLTSTASGMFTCTSFAADRGGECLGEWWATPEAVACLAWLDAALAGEPEPAAWSLVDMVHFYTTAAGVQARVRAGPNSPEALATLAAPRALLRRTALSSHPAAAPPDGWRELDLSQPPSALLLVHSFAGGGDGTLGSEGLTLRSLLLADSVWEASP